MRYSLFTYTTVGCLIALVVVPFVSAQGVTDGRHGININGPNARDYSLADAQTLADSVVASGVQWVFMPMVWEWAEPNAPISYDDGTGRWQGPSGNWHAYDLGQAKAMYDRLRANTRNGKSVINVVIGMYRHPRWSGGNAADCPVTDPNVNPFSAEFPKCGKIYTTYKTIFTNGVKDFAAYLATTFPDAQFFSVWNEPNGANFFSPQPPLNPDPIGEYLNILFWPAKNAIIAVRSAQGRRTPTFIGPELAGPKTSCVNTDLSNDSNWGTSYPSTNYLTHWIGPLLQFFPNEVDVITVHNYPGYWQCFGYDGINPPNSGEAGAIATKMGSLNTYKPIWITEANFSDGITPSNKGTVADTFCEAYKDQTMDGSSNSASHWTKTFWFSLSGGLAPDGSYGHALYSAPGVPVGGASPTMPDMFAGVVNKTYACSGHKGTTWRSEAGAYDGTVSAIHYSGTWWSDSVYYSTAYNGTLDYNNMAGATATFTFYGTGITWRHLLFHHMGIANVTIDGINKGNYDLYSSADLWQQDTAFTGLSLGAHTIVITNTGTKNAASSDYFLDVDALIVQ